jgi:peptide-methionine (S)-S-oxide reductase
MKPCWIFSLNRQGPDIGNQYRSAIFFHSTDQERAALAAIKTLDQSGRWPQPVVTKVEAAMPFWRAEEYHQRYLEKHGLGFCSI